VSGFSERAIRYALKFLKREKLIVERVNLLDVRKKKYKLASVAQPGRAADLYVPKLVISERSAGSGFDSQLRLPKNMGRCLGSSV
jgi:hypothetical protein